MNNGPMLFLGLFASMAISWATFVFGPIAQLGNLQPARTVAALPAVYPNSPPGLAAQGAGVYRACGCAYCHTRQVRPAELGADLAHGWGVRRSVAHDYIFDQTVMLGERRLGPDLANAGLRMDSMAVLARLWEPRMVNKLDAAHSIMPSYRYLFDVRKTGPAPSAGALPVRPEFAPAGGHEIVPRVAARALAAYVAGLRQEPYLFEAPPPGIAGTNAAAGTNAPAAGTNGPGNGTNAPAAAALPGAPGNPRTAIGDLQLPGLGGSVGSVGSVGSDGSDRSGNPQSAIRNPQSNK